MGDEQGGRFERACRGASFFVPFGVALWHVGSSASWRDDLALLRGLAWVGNDRNGALSSILVEASFLVPLGSVHFRAGLAAALALAASGYALYFVTRRILDEGAETPRLSAALAVVAALTATLGSSGQREGTIAGGGAVALLVALVLLAVRPERALLHPRGALGVGLLFGALAAESGVVALALAAGIGSGLVVTRRAVGRREMAWAIAGAVASAGFAHAPLYVRPLAASTFLDLGRAAAMGTAPFESPVRSLGGAGALADEVGRLALALAALGGALGLVRARLRASVVPLVVVVLLDVLASLREGSLLSSEELAPLHLVSLAFLCAGVATFVHTIAVTLLDMRLAMAREATLLLVMGDLALAAASAEEASFLVDRSASLGAQTFTDEAVERLAPGALVMLRSRATAHRLWAARLAEGVRPDVLVLPVPIFGDKRIAVGLLRAEPALQGTLRDVSLEGRPGEEALTVLADARPTLVELDPRWDRRVVSHLVADHFWMRFAPEPLGPSDRKGAFADLRTRFIRVLAAGTVDERVDTSTAAVLRARLTDAAAGAAVLGDRDEAIALLEQLGKVSSADPFVVELTRRLAAGKSTPIDLKSLLH